MTDDLIGGSRSFIEQLAAFGRDALHDQPVSDDEAKEAALRELAGAVRVLPETFDALALGMKPDMDFKEYRYGYLFRLIEATLVIAAHVGAKGALAALRSENEANRGARTKGGKKSGAKRTMALAAGKTLAETRAHALRREHPSWSAAQIAARIKTGWSDALVKCPGRDMLRKISRTAN
jgi:hypothetical protein